MYPRKRRPDWFLGLGDGLHESQWIQAKQKLKRRVLQVWAQQNDGAAKFWSFKWKNWNDKGSLW